LLSTLLTWLLVHYGKAHLIDRIGRHKLHADPTPRGGGLAIMIAFCVGLGSVMLGTKSELLLDQLTGLLTGLLVVASIGFWDDLRGASARLRFIVHVLGALFCISGWITTLWIQEYYFWLCVVSLVLAFAWSINLHNFMDGINGHLGIQAFFVFCFVVVLAFFHQQGVMMLVAGLAASVTLGFLPYNFPKARIFLGDVGSGFLGLLIAYIVFWAIQAKVLSFETAALLVSAFFIDATCTLLFRYFKGKRWYQRHTEHLYQWLARTGRHHYQVVGLYVLWNLLVVVPSISVIEFLGKMASGYVVFLVYLLGTITWWLGKSHLLRVTKKSRRKLCSLGH
jgi:UDP-N-acetylmuramyl pentapeptide phosphotransferase/UDP-N-acetylglucosamine-1-phosphate transferase